MIPQRLQEVLDRRGWSQSQLAEKIHTHAATVNRWLRCKIPPSRKALARVAEATGCDLDWLLTGEGEMFFEGYNPFMSKEEREKEEQAQKESFSEAQEWEDEQEALEAERRNEERKQEIAKLLAKTEAVLEFKFKHQTQCYSDSLATTINALYRAIQLEEKFVPKRGLRALMDPLI